MHSLSQILREYPGVYYDQDSDTLCVDINENPMTIETDASKLIEDHFHGETVSTGDNSDPNGDTIALTGEDYVKHLGGVVDAFKEVGVETW